MPTTWLSTALLTFALAPAAATAQDHRVTLPADVASISRASCGVAFIDGVLLANGPDWKAVFEPAGPIFTPAFGRGVPRAQSVALRLESVSRGVDSWTPSELAAPSLVGSTVVYERAPWLAEMYATRAEGIEQSFTFDQLPSGTGDLVVRVRIASSMPLAASLDPRGGMLAELRGDGGASLGGVSIGAVTGIDAAGARTSGALHLAGDVLELRLPAAFVERAALPLVLDPLVGAVITFGTAFADGEPDVAYDVTNDKYLVVWERAFAANDVAIRGQLVTGSGALSGGLLALTTDAFAHDSVCVANCNQTDSFLVAWHFHATEIGDFIAGRSVAASNGALSPGAPTLGFGVDPELASEATTADNEVLMAWVGTAPTGNLGIKAAQITVAGAGAAPDTLAEVALTTDPEDANVAISRSGGTAGRFLVTWHDVDPSAFGPEGDIAGVVIDRNLGIDGALATIAGSSTLSELDPSCDGDGARWIVAYEAFDVVSDSLQDILYRTVVLSGSTLVVGPNVGIEQDITEIDVDPAVGFTGEEVLVAWRDPAGLGQTEIKVATLSLETGLSCSGTYNVDSGTAEITPCVGTKFSGSASGDDALIAWDFGNGIKAIQYQSNVGSVANLGGGCGDASSALAPCAVQGNAGFVHRLSGAVPGLPAFLVLSFETLDVGCGPCRLIPDPFSGLVLAAGVVAADGTASVPMKIPADANVVGLEFFDQWIVDASPGACIALGMDMSSAIRVSIE